MWWVILNNSYSLYHITHRDEQSSDTGCLVSQPLLFRLHPSVAVWYFYSHFYSIVYVLRKGQMFITLFHLFLSHFIFRCFSSVSRSLRDDTANVVAWYCLIFALSINNMSCFFIFRFSISLILQNLYMCIDKKSLLIFWLFR
jgi:hypothetical protein